MFQPLLNVLKSHRNIALFSHVRPDGDCIGAQVALSLWLSKQGINVNAFNDDPVPVNLQWMTGFFPVINPTDEKIAECDLYVLLDGNSPSRFGTFETWLERYPRPVLCIDHHPDAEDMYHQAVIDTSASSTCELIARMIREDGGKMDSKMDSKMDPEIDPKIDSKIAKALYAGINTDTGSLQFSSVSPQTVRVVADLLEAGSFTPDQVAEKLYSRRSLEELRLLSRSLSTIELRMDNQLAFTVVTEEMLEEVNGVDTGGLVQYPLSIEGVKVAVLFKDLGEKGVKISLRSRSDIDVNRWARQLNGGGHARAAGAWHPGPMEKAIEDTLRLGAPAFRSLELSSDESEAQ